MTERKFATIPPLEGSASQDWTGVYTTPVKDQGYCGSCWAFSATEQIESDYWRQTGDEVILSTQQVTSCTPYIFGGGCNGGWTENAFEYAEAGLELASDYPYTSGTGKTLVRFIRFITLDVNVRLLFWLSVHIQQRVSPALARQTRANT